MKAGYYSRDNMQQLDREHRPQIAIVGGGMAGTAAAIAAARLGLSTLLMHNRCCLGGPASTECDCDSDGHLIVGGSNWTTRDARETGPIEDMRLTGEDRFENGWRNYFSQVMRDLCEQEPLLTLLLNTEVYKVDTKERCINKLTARTLGSDLTHHVYPQIVLDCSGDSFVGLAAGAEFRMGREAKAEFDESLAPDASDACVLGSSLYFRAIDTGKKISFTPPPWAYKIAESQFVGRSHKNVTRGYWWIECGGDMDTICDNEKIYQNLLSILYGIWDHIKNHGDHGAENYAIEWISNIPAKRESRRLMGKMILTESDILENRVFHDGIAYSGGNVDLHPIAGFFSGNYPCGAEHGILSPGLYQIPLRCIVSNNIDNLMMAGRNISVSHVALSSTRMMGTCAALGQAAAGVAFLCQKYKRLPSEISEPFMPELRKVLYRIDHTLPAVEVTDPENLCRDGIVTVSSTMPLALTEVSGSESLSSEGIPSAQSFIAANPKVDRVFFLMNNRAGTVKMVCAELVKQQGMYDFRAGEIVAKAQCVLPPGLAVEACFEFHAVLERGKRYYIRFDDTTEVEVCFCETYLPGIWKSRAAMIWPPQGDNKNLCIRFSPQQLPFQGENLLNTSNRGGDAFSIWISDPRSGFPQTAEIRFREKSMCSCVELIFDTNLDHINIYSYQNECVKDYRLEGLCQGQYRMLAEVKDNFLRFRKHVFTPLELEGLRIVVTSSRGTPSARIYQIRAYAGENIP